MNQSLTKGAGLIVMANGDTNWEPLDGFWDNVCHVCMWPLKP